MSLAHFAEAIVQHQVMPVVGAFPDLEILPIDIQVVTVWNTFSDFVAMLFDKFFGTFEDLNDFFMDQFDNFADGFDDLNDLFMDRFYDFQDSIEDLFAPRRAGRRLVKQAGGNFLINKINAMNDAVDNFGDYIGN